MGLARRAQGARRRRCRCAPLTTSNAALAVQPRCALRVPAADGHLRCCRASTMYRDIACGPAPSICPCGARNAAPPNSRTGSWHRNDVMIELPEYARVVRTLSRGEHAYLALLPRLAESPAARRIESPTVPLVCLLDSARVRIRSGEGFVWVDDEAPAIVLMEDYYRRGNPLDLYLDLIHELTHLRQLAEGKNLWDRSLHYVDRPTEIEGYAIAIEEGRRLGMADTEVVRHLSNPWLSPADVLRLRDNVERFLAGRGRRKRSCGIATRGRRKNET